ncbi:MAG: flagellar biosynthesis repressor FlbT [Rhodospirillales bacterium]
MPLKLTLKPNEKVLIGNAVIVNGDSKSEIILLNQVPLLRERDIITEEEADNISKKIYLTILNMYAEPQKEQNFHSIYFDLIKIMLDTYMDKELLLKITELSEEILRGKHYAALKKCKKLIKYEQEVLSHAG